MNGLLLILALTFQSAEIQVKMLSIIKDVSDIRSITEMNQKWIAEADKLHGTVLQNVCNEVQYQEWQKNVSRFNDAEKK